MNVPKLNVTVTICRWNCIFLKGQAIQEKNKVLYCPFFGNFFHSIIFLGLCCVQNITREILNIRIIYLSIPCLWNHSRLIKSLMNKLKRFKWKILFNVNKCINYELWTTVNSSNINFNDSVKNKYEKMKKKLKERKLWFDIAHIKKIY